jgi:hypothetical protein
MHLNYPYESVNNVAIARQTSWRTRRRRRTGNKGDVYTASNVIGSISAGPGSADDGWVLWFQGKGVREDKMGSKQERERGLFCGQDVNINFSQRSQRRNTVKENEEQQTKLSDYHGQMEQTKPPTKQRSQWR